MLPSEHIIDRPTYWGYAVVGYLYQEIDNPNTDSEFIVKLKEIRVFEDGSREVILERNEHLIELSLDEFLRRDPDSGNHIFKKVSIQ